MSTSPEPAAPLAGTLTDPCLDRNEAGARLHDAAHGAPARLDVFLSGTVFIDMIFSGMQGLPAPGTEIYTGGLGSAPGGIANMAVAMSRLGLRVGLAAAFGDVPVIGEVGDDVFGGYLWRTLTDQEGIDLSPSRQLRRWPTPVTVSLAYDADRSLITYGEPLPFPAGELVQDPPDARSCCIHLDSGLPHWARDFRRRGSMVFADVGWDASGTWSPELLSWLDDVDVFLPNAAEAMAYTRTDNPRAALHKLAERVPTCVVKLGAAGSIGIDATTGEESTADAIPVTALDTTGAGDVFAAAFVFGTIAGWPLVDRLKFGNLCAGLSVRHFSGSLGSPCWGEIAAWGEGDDADPNVLAQYGFVVPYIPEYAVDDIPRALPTVGYGAGLDGADE